MDEPKNIEHVEKRSDLVTVTVKHDYSQDELAEISDLLAKAVQDKSHVESEKKVVVKQFSDRIALHDKEIKDFANKVSNGHAYIEKAAEMYLDYTIEKRLYYDKRDGSLLKEEPFHASDYQHKINFYAKQNQIEENNAAGEFAEGDPEGGDALDQVISEKRNETKAEQNAREGAMIRKLQEKPVPKNNLPDDYGKSHEYQEENLPSDKPKDLFERADDDDALPEV